MKTFKLFSIGKKIAPRWLVKQIRNLFTFQNWEVESMRQTNPFVNEPDEIIYKKSRFKAGILYSRIQYHKHWIAACRELKVSYQIIYIERADWMEQVQKSDCDIFLVWPDIRSQEIKQMWDERLRIMVDELKMKIYPSMT